MTVIITAFLGWQLQYLSFDFEFEKFFPKNHPDSQLYQKHVSQFGYDNDFLQIILQEDEGVFNAKFLSNASAFEKELETIDDVEKVFSPLSLQHVVKTPTGVVVFPLIHSDEPDRLDQDSIRIFENPFYRAAFSDDATSVSIYMGHAHFDDPIRTELLLSSIKELAQKHQLPKVRMVGKLSASQVFIQYIKNDFGKFLIASLIISFILLLLIFRHVASALLPFVISLLSILWVFGLLTLMGIKINLLSSLLPPILFFVSMSDAVHLLNAITKSEAKERKEKIAEAVKAVWIPTLLTSLTTAIGFLSLLWITTEPVQILGVFASIGIVIAFVITFSLGIVISAAIAASTKTTRILIPAGLLPFLTKRKRLVFFSIAALVLSSIPGITKLNVNSFLLEDLPKDAQVRKDFEFADSKLGGSKPYEIRVEVADSSLSVWDMEVMNEILKIEQYLLEQYPVVKVQSPSTIIKYLTMVNNSGLNSYFKFPQSLDEYNETLRLMQRIDPKRMDKLVTEDSRVARLIGFIPEYGSMETGKRNETLRNYLDKVIDHSKIAYEITGTTYLIDKSHELLSKHLLTGLLTAIGVIGIVLGIYFRSWKLLMVSLIPNVIPLLMIAGILGWLGISLKMTTSVIFAVGFGIAVDDTIHMMSFYLKSKEADPVKRMNSTFRHAGSAMLITTLIMSLGFVIFLLSNFGATFYMGLFISLSLSLALMIDLTILPLLLISTQKNATTR